MKLLCLSKYGKRAASPRQRILQYAPYLAAHGIEIEFRPLLDEEYLTRMLNGQPAHPLHIVGRYWRRLKDSLDGFGCDAILVQHELFPHLPGAFERLVGVSRKPIIYDIDDAVFHKYASYRFAPARRLMGRKLEPLLRSTSLCLCGNEYLRDYVARFAPRAEIVPTVVDTNQYQAASPDPTGAVTLGWMGSPSTWAYVEPLLPTLLAVLKRRGVNFLVVGAGERSRGIDGIIARDWEEASEVADVQKMSIGIMPLRDDEWARGKCGYKLIQYMACGLPVIASPIGVNRQIVQDGWNGFLPQTPQGWADALDRLLTNADLRAEMGSQGRARVEESYSLASQEPRVLRFIQEAVERSGEARP